MKPYPSYKDSGVGWVGEIPSDWNMISLKHLVSTKITDGPHETPEFVDEGIPFLSVESVQDNKLDFNRKRGFITEDIHKEYSKKCKPQRDDVFLVKSGSTTGKSTIVETDEEFNIWSPLCIIRSDKSKVIPRFTFTSLQSYYFRKFVEIEWSFGTQPNIGMGVIENIRIIVPPLTKQKQIVSFLDHKTQKIDELIEKTEQKIELLKEKRTSLINHCVTKGLNGLDGNACVEQFDELIVTPAETKDSGVEWIGEIPIHYDIVRLKFLCSVKTGSRDTQDKVEDGEYPFYVRSPKVERINSYSFEGESVLTVGDGVGTGKVFHYVNGKFEFHQRVYKFSDFNRVTGKFFYWYIKHHFIFVTEDQNSKSTVDSLRRPLIDGFQFVVPPTSEQTQIVEYLDEQTQKIDTTIEKETQRIDLLKEYRQSLISEVVTGKIDVRDWNS